MNTEEIEWFRKSIAEEMTRKELEDRLCEQHIRIDQLKQALAKYSEIPEWDDNKVIDFVNWYVRLHKLGTRYLLENQTIINSFKNGDEPEIWNA